MESVTESDLAGLSAAEVRRLIGRGEVSPVEVVEACLARVDRFNGTVNAADYAVWRKSFGKIGVALAADGNGNKRIDIGDYEVWRAHFGQKRATTARLLAVPEPATVLLLAVGCLFFHVFGRRSRR